MKNIFLTFIAMFSVGQMLATDMTSAFNGNIKAKFECSDQYSSVKSEANVMFAVENENTWVDTKIKIQAPSGEVDLQRTLIGYSFITAGEENIFVEIGRMQLKDSFDSKMQFDSAFNGIHLGFEKGNILIHGGPHIVNSKDKHFGLLSEMVVGEVFNLPMSVSYGITNWNLEDNFAISELKITYNFPSVFGKSVDIYTSGLMNHKQSSKNKGFYAGVSVGRIVNARDWMFDVCYQYDDEKLIPWHDFSGIGRGMRYEFIYALTDHLDACTKLEMSDINLGQVSIIYHW